MYVRGAQEPWKSPPNWPPFFFYDQRNAHLGGQSEGERGFHIFFQLLQAGNHGRWRIVCLSLLLLLQKNLTYLYGNLQWWVSMWRAEGPPTWPRQLVKVN